MPTITARVIATCFALVSFASALVVGIVAGNPTWVVLMNAVLVMLVCLVIGSVIGGVAQHVIDQHIERYKADHPLPGEPSNTSRAGGDPSRSTAMPSEEGAAASA